ncbi:MULTISPECIES: hypothetical protein [Pontibacillus]|uniref:DUF3951 domain-containing protein n=1 Tax=Pontibacillus chungwhensis TaxID=265426 RepID=A0ABY8V3K3_9BACI|nr:MULTISPECIES: hypothetical protein [Pontibacillus]MCD5324515.1 hypothetical protein [Pontibacillus sp. HN14]WIF99190.1 hypothetical protein QNI29_05900 [Pontibacillus chungwhensis]
MESLVTILIISSAVLVMGVTKYKDYKNKKEHPPKKWEGKTEREMEQDRESADRLTEQQKGNGRGGGPF